MTTQGLNLGLNPGLNLGTNLSGGFVPGTPMNDFFLDDDDDQNNDLNSILSTANPAGSLSTGSLSTGEPMDATNSAPQITTFKDWLALADDQTFASNTDYFFTQLPQELVHHMKKAQGNHGKTFTRQKISVLDQVKQVIVGEYGSFGLHTDFLLGLTEQQMRVCRSAIRVAAFMEDTGKIRGQANKFKTHVEDTLKIAREQLSQNAPSFGLDQEVVPLVLALIQHHRFIREATHPRKARNLQEVCNNLQQAYNALPNKETVTFDLFCRTLINLFLAHATTLKRIQNIQAIYKRHTIENQNLEFTNFQWLSNLKGDLDREWQKWQQANNPSGTQSIVPPTSSGATPPMQAMALQRPPQMIQVGNLPPPTLPSANQFRAPLPIPPRGPQGGPQGAFQAPSPILPPTQMMTQNTQTQTTSFTQTTTHPTATYSATNHPKVGQKKLPSSSVNTAAVQKNTEKSNRKKRNS